LLWSVSLSLCSSSVQQPTPRPIVPPPLSKLRWRPSQLWRASIGRFELQSKLPLLTVEGNFLPCSAALDWPNDWVRVELNLIKFGCLNWIGVWTFDWLLLARKDIEVYMLSKVWRNVWIWFWIRLSYVDELKNVGLICIDLGLCLELRSQLVVSSRRLIWYEYVAVQIWPRDCNCILIELILKE
jgi:hypothetical protein